MRIMYSSFFYLKYLIFTYFYIFFCDFLPILPPNKLQGSCGLGILNIVIYIFLNYLFILYSFQLNLKCATPSAQ